MTRYSAEIALIASGVTGASALLLVLILCLL